MRLVMVIAWKAVTMTLVPINFKTDRYSPNFMKIGIETVGIKINIQRFDSSLSDQTSPNRRANESHIANNKKHTSALIIIACFF